MFVLFLYIFVFWRWWNRSSKNVNNLCLVRVTFFCWKKREKNIENKFSFPDEKNSSDYDYVMIKKRWWWWWWKVVYSSDNKNTVYCACVCVRVGWRRRLHKQKKKNKNNMDKLIEHDWRNEIIYLFSIYNILF